MATSPGGPEGAKGKARGGSVRRPDSLTDLEDYEGTMVGMRVTEGPGGSQGLASALDGRPGSGQLATTMLGMQSEFMDELGLREDPVVRKAPPPGPEEPVRRKSLGSSWSKLALACLALSALLATAVLVLHVEGNNLQRERRSHLALRDDLELKSSQLQEELSQRGEDGACAEYQQLFVHWVTAFCKIANCTNELCHKFWNYFQGNCYYFSKGEQAWERSRQDCVSQGSELLIVRNKREQKFVAGFDPQSVYWIGMKEAPQSSTWMWVDGSPLRDDLVFWDREYPDSHFDYKLEDFKYCAVLRAGSWANAACAEAHRWICKRRSEPLPVSL